MNLRFDNMQFWGTVIFSVCWMKNEDGEFGVWQDLSTTHNSMAVNTKLLSQSHSLWRRSFFLPPSIESRYKAADRQEFENFSFQTNDTQLNGHGGAQKPSVSLYTQASIWIRPSQRFQRFHCHQRIIFLDDGTFFLSNLCNNRNFINHEDGIQERILQDVLQ